MVLHRQNLYHLELMLTHLVKNKNHHQVQVKKKVISSAASLSSSSVLNSTSSNDGNLVEDLPNVYTDSVIDKEPIKQSSSAKRKSEENHVLNNKQKHLEKTLSAAQRDQLLLQEAKDDAQFGKTLTDTLRESNRVFTELLHGISKSMTDRR